MSELTYAERKAPGSPWKLEHMYAVARRKHVRLWETDAMVSESGVPALHGLTVSLGDRAVVAVSELLAEPDRVAVVAHELGHLALGHLSTRILPKNPAVGRITGDHNAELEHSVDIWAAHALVDEGVYDALIAGGMAPDDALDHTAAALALPEHVLATWAANREIEFDMDPKDWLYAEAGWFELSPPPYADNDAGKS